MGDRGPFFETTAHSEGETWSPFHRYCLNYVPHHFTPTSSNIIHLATSTYPRRYDDLRVGISFVSVYYEPSSTEMVFIDTDETLVA